MRLKAIGVLAAVIAAAGLLIVQQPSLDKQLARIEPELEARIKAREIQIDPAELLDIIYNNNIGVRILDIRDETDFNIFHIADSEHVSMAWISNPKWVKNLPEETVLVLVSNDEKRATLAWKLLTTQKVINLYILEGGINHWLNIYGPEPDLTASPQPDGDDTLRHYFNTALGEKNMASEPDPAHVQSREYVKKIKQVGRPTPKSGSCG